MKWTELSICVPAEYAEPLSEIFRRYGDGGVAIEESKDYDPDLDPVASEPSDVVTIRTYLRQNATYDSRLSRIWIAVRLIALLAPLGELKEISLEEGEWLTAWRSHYGILRIGRLIIRPSWQEYAARVTEAVVVQDPGMAFGTGHHPTTRRCLEQLEKRVTDGIKLLDLGTGSGILAVAAAKLGAASVIALDDDGNAVKSARDNAKNNGIASVLRVIHGTLPHPLVLHGGYQLAVANVTAQVIVGKVGSLMNALAPQGLLVVSGILYERLHDVTEALDEANASVVEQFQDGDWVTLVIKRTAAQSASPN